MAPGKPSISVSGTTSIRAIRSASDAGKKGVFIEPVDHALGRSRGGLTMKIHLLCDSRGFPITFTLLADQRADSSFLSALLEQVRLPGRLSRPKNAAAISWRSRGTTVMRYVTITRIMKCGPSFRSTVCIDARSRVFRINLTGRIIVIVT